jgi:hypothetical protein
VDYVALSGTATILAGKTTVDIPVTPIDDDIYEGPETVVLTLTPQPIYKVGAAAASAKVTIVDNEPTVTVSAPDNAAAETKAGRTPNPGKFRITRAGGGVANDLVVSYTVGGAATAGADYAGLPGTATILAGKTTVDIVVSPVDDAIHEGKETVVLTLTAKPAYRVGTAASATVAIADND